MATLSDDEVGAALEELDGWEREGDAISRQVKVDTFRDAIAFVVRLSYEAEAADHHPDIEINYNKVRLTLSTHSEGGITQKDVDLARAIDSLAPAS
jgi:4a-hydroxytetrahydrobiopterin dehydratase